MSGLLAILGSPRRRGNSTLLAEAALEGGTARGAVGRSIRLHGMDIRPCQACDACRRPLGSGCAIPDDMQQVYPALRETDALLVASPVYWFTVSAQTKLFLDRCYAMHTAHGHELGGKRMGLILTYGDEDCLASGAMNALRTFQDACRYLGARYIGAVHGRAGEAGEVAGNAALLEQARRLGEKLATP